VHARVAPRVIIAAALASLALAGAAHAAPSDQYVVRNLVSSSAVVPADRFDANLKNPWGLVSSPTSPWWPANNGTNTSTIVPATGAVNNTVVQVAGDPTGIVWNGTAGAFGISGGQSSFIFNTMSGAISGWRGGTASEVKVPAHDAFYLGLALAVTPTGPQLYAADFKHNKVEVYNSQWALVNDDKFVDPTLPAGYGPTESRPSAAASSSLTPSRVGGGRIPAVRSRARARATSARSTSPAPSSPASRAAAS
jgi:hypothetical protein